MTTKIYPHVPLKASLRRKLKLCWLLLNDHPIMYRVGVTRGNIFLPATLYIESTHIEDCLVGAVDEKGAVVKPPFKEIPEYSSPLR